MIDGDLLGTPYRESRYLFSGLWRGRGKGVWTEGRIKRDRGREREKHKEREKSKETEKSRERERKGEMGALGRRKRGRSCHFKREMERKELRL